MNPNSASHLIEIEEGVDYSTLDKTIFAIQCINTNTVSVLIQADCDNKWVEFPPGSFISGALYPIYLKKIKAGSDVKFVGYAYHTKPFAK